MFKEFINKNKELLLIFGVLTIYLCFGFSLSRHNQPDINIYLGADNTRAFGDLMFISGVTHYRIKVHPLLLILLQPITLLLDGIVHHKATTLVIVQALVGTSCVYFVYKILFKFSRNTMMNALLTLVYAMSFSNILFSTIPETFIFAALFLLMFWYYVLDNIGIEQITWKEIVILLFFGIVLFGITITNYFQFLIGLFAILILAKIPVKEKIKTLFVILLGNLVSFFGIAKFQQIAWKGDTPFFLDSYLVLLGEDRGSFGELAYTNFEFSISKVFLWFEQIFIRPFVSTWPELGIDTTDNLRILFTEGYFLADFLAVVLFCLLLFSILVILRTPKIRREGSILLTALLFNIVLHFVYGYYESFIYSSHFIFLIILIVGLGMQNIPRKCLMALDIFLVVLLLCEIVLNTYSYREIISLVVIYMGKAEYPVTTIFVKIFLLMSVVLGILCLIKRYIKDIIIINPEKKFRQVDLICGIIGLYGILVFISAFFVCFNN